MKNRDSTVQGEITATRSALGRLALHELTGCELCPTRLYACLALFEL